MEKNGTTNGVSKDQEFDFLCGELIADLEKGQFVWPPESVKKMGAKTRIGAIKAGDCLHIKLEGNKEIPTEKTKAPTPKQAPRNMGKESTSPKGMEH